MFMGITAHHDARRVASYEDACKALARASRTPTGKRRTEKPQGFHLGASRNHGVTWVREQADNSIAFRLYETDVVVWHPDNSVDIENYGTVTTSEFAGRFLPGTIALRHTTSRRGHEGGHRGISYSPGGDTSWSGLRLCFGGVVRFVPDGESWAPDPDTCDVVRFPVLDRRKARELGKLYHLKDFRTWLAMAPRHMTIEHDEWDYDECVEALERRDFRRAAEHLPLVEDTGAYRNELKPLPIRTQRYTQYVTMGSFERLKLAIHDREGAFSAEEFTTIGVREFDRHNARVRRMERLGGNWGGWGL